MSRTVSAVFVALLCVHLAAAAPAAAVPAARQGLPPQAAAQAARLSSEEAQDQAQAEGHRHGVSASDTPVGDMMGMQMVFFAGNTFQLWFKSFNISNAGELTAACLGVVVMAALYEGLKVARILLAGKIVPAGLSSKGHWLQAFLHLTQITVSYLLMLAVMTYSTWMMMSVCGGAALGYLVFGRLVPAKSLLGSTSEHCH